VDCIRDGSVPLTDGRLGLEVVRILEAAGMSLQQKGAAVPLSALVETASSVPGSTVSSSEHHGNGNSNGHGTVGSIPGRTAVSM